MCKIFVGWNACEGKRGQRRLVESLWMVNGEEEKGSIS